MAHLLPTFPRVVFSIIEPFSLVAGFWGTLVDTPWFIAEQIPNSDVLPVSEGATIVAWQLGNLYLLMAFMGLAILNTTSEARVVRAYLFVLWLGDIGHIGFTAYGLGVERMSNVTRWNTLTSANVAFTLFLFLTRSAYFVGLFGPDSNRPASVPKKKA